MARTLMAAVAAVLMLGSAAHAQTGVPDDHRAPVVWTAAGAGAGFGVGLWAGLTAFDDAINSDRKVWTSAVVGAAVGGVAGYLIGRLRQPERPARVGRGRLQTEALDPQTLDRLIKSIRFSQRAGTTRPDAGLRVAP